MTVGPQTVVFALHSVMRLGHAARRAYQDGVVNTALTLPDVDHLSIDTRDRAVQIVVNTVHQGRLPQDPWMALADAAASGGNDAATLCAGARLIEAAREFDQDFADIHKRRGLQVLEQWSSAANRQTALGRIGIELADIALDYVGANPRLFGVEGEGAKLITSVAASLSELLPCPDDPSPAKAAFAAGAVRIFTEAGLRALSNNVDNTIHAAHLREIAKSMLKPLLDAVAAGDQADQPWYDLRDEFLGPVAEAAIAGLAKHQAAIFGSRFAIDKQLGRLTQAVLMAIKDDGIADDLGKAGVLRIYKALLNTVAERPGLFVSGGDTTNALTRELLTDTAKALRAHTPPFDQALMTDLAVTSIDVVRRNAATLIKVDAGEWSGAANKIASFLLQDISEGLSAGLQGNATGLQRMFSNAQTGALLRIVAEEVAATPGMIAGIRSPEVRELVSILTRVIAQQQGTALGAVDWLAVARLAVREVAQNPGRLIKANLPQTERQLLFILLNNVVSAVSSAGQRSDGNVLFGETLIEIIKHTLSTAASHAAKALANESALQDLIAGLATFAGQHQGEIGRREVIALFKHWVTGALDTGQLPSFDAATLLPVLRGD